MKVIVTCLMKGFYKEYYLLSIAFTILILFNACQSDVPHKIKLLYNDLPESVDFDFHIKPILSNKCFAYHGPDEESRKANLRLDLDDKAFSSLESGDAKAYAIKTNCKETDQLAAALITDLKQRGLLEDTLVVWGGEFGWTSYTQCKLTYDNYGRDHHPRCYTIFMAGASIKKGFSFRQTDDLAYNIIKEPVHVHDFQATLLHLTGINHEKLTYKFQGRRYRLTDQFVTVVNDILA